MLGAHHFFTLDEAQNIARETRAACRQAARRTKRVLVFSHITALRLAGMTVELDTTLDTTLLHITIASTKQRSHLVGVQEHVWSHDMTYSADTDELVTAVTPQQALCQMAPYTSQDSLTVAMDWLTCHNDELRQCTHTELSDYINEVGRFRGVTRCRKALARSVEGTDSPRESELRLGLVDFGLPTPEVNHPISDFEEGTEWLCDIVYVDEHVVIEYDGEYHYDKNRWRQDLHKRNRLQHLGWKVLVATKQDFASPRALEDFIAMVARALGQGRRDILIYGHTNW